MASNIAETSTFEANVLGPDNGDTVNATSVRDGLQDLANRTTFLGESLQGQHLLWPAWWDSSGFTDVATFTSGLWDGTGFMTQSLATTIAGVVVYPVPSLAVPSSAAYKLTQVRMAIAPVSGHGGSFPLTVMPRVRVYSRTISGAALTLEHEAIDTSSDFTGYEAPHEVTTSGLSLNLDDGKYYFIAGSGEMDASDGLDGLVITAMRCTILRI